MDRLIVEMPKKKIYKAKKSNGSVHIYYTLRAYRNSKGNPTSDAIMIGTMDSETGMLIPNQNFFKVYDCEVNIKVKGEKNDREVFRS